MSEPIAPDTTRPRHDPPHPPSLATRAKGLVCTGLYAAANTCLAALRIVLWPRRRPRTAGRVCIYRIGNIGDIVCALPAMQAIRRAYPDAHLTLVTSSGSPDLPGARDLLHGADWLDEILAYDTAAVSSVRGRLRLIRDLRARQFDVWVELPASLANFSTMLRNMLLARFSGAGWAYGWRYRALRLWARAQSETRQFPNEVDALRAIVREAGFDPGPVVFGLPVDGEARRTARRLLAEAGLAGRPLVAIAPGAKRPTNRWPVERFGAVARDLASHGFGIIVVGGPADRAIGDSVVLGLDGTALNAAGLCGAIESAALLAETRLLVCNDSGVQHLAAAVGVPCVAVFAARDFRGKWHPHGIGNVALERWVDCHTCLLDACPRGNACVDAVGVDDVTGSASRLLRGLFSVMSRRECGAPTPARVRQAS